MGTIDSTTHRFACPNCDTEETLTVREKGSGWRSSWENPPDSELFVVEWKRSQFGDEPKPVSVKCKGCGSEAARKEG